MKISHTVLGAGSVLCMALAEEHKTVLNIYWPANGLRSAIGCSTAPDGLRSNSAIAQRCFARFARNGNSSSSNNNTKTDTIELIYISIILPFHRPIFSSGRMFHMNANIQPTLTHTQMITVIQIMSCDRFGRGRTWHTVLWRKIAFCGEMREEILLLWPKVNSWSTQKRQKIRQQSHATVRGKCHSHRWLFNFPFNRFGRRYRRAAKQKTADLADKIDADRSS